MRRACKLAITVQGRPGYRLALRDIHQALSTGGDDACVFAYRTIEDLARAVSGKRGELRASDWASLHSHLRTTKDSFMKRIAPLHKARQAAAHGDESDAELIAARTSREERIAIARRVVAEVLDGDANLPFTMSECDSCGPVAGQ